MTTTNRKNIVLCLAGCAVLLSLCALPGCTERNPAFQPDLARTVDGATATDSGLGGIDHASCADACEKKGLRQCAKGGYRTCGDFNDDPCLEWSPTTACPAGEGCQDGLCIPFCGASPCACSEGETLDCSPVGECKDGYRICAKGTYGPCQWRTGPFAEICDGKDNDCSGAVDDGLSAPLCEKQAGVCAGAHQVCGGAAGWQACTASVYSQASGGLYQVTESLCDGRDNDCNGEADESPNCCTPRCGDRVCGLEPQCGTSCGTCKTPQVCAGSGQCVAPRPTFSLSAGGAADDRGIAVVADSTGAIFLTGDFRDELRLGKATLTSAGGSDVFVAKIDANSTIAWAVSGGGAGDDGPLTLALGPDGGVWVTGEYTDDSATFGGAVLPAPSLFGTNGFVTKVASDGRFAWAQGLGGGSFASIGGVTTDAQGRGYVAGVFGGQASLGSKTLDSNGRDQGVVAQLAADGGVLWAVVTEGSGHGRLWAITGDGRGALLVAGEFSSQFTWGQSTLQSAGNFDLFVAKISASGDKLWAVGAGGTFDEEVWDLTSDGAGAGVVVGHFMDRAHFGSTTLESRGGTDFYVAKVSEDGTFAWANRGGGSGNDVAHRIVFDATRGQLHVTGSYEDESVFGGGANKAISAANPGTNLYRATVDAAGNFQSAYTTFGSGADHGRGISVDSRGTIVVTGYFANTIELDSKHPLTSAGGTDILLYTMQP